MGIDRQSSLASPGEEKVFNILVLGNLLNIAPFLATMQHDRVVNQSCEDFFWQNQTPAHFRSPSQV